MERSVARSECGKRVFSHSPFYKGQKYGDGVIQAITERGAKVLYLPTYLSDFNPIEMM